MKRMKIGPKARLVFVLLLSASFLAGCGGGSESDPARQTFSIKDTSGAAVIGATVYAIPAADVAEMGTVALVLSAGTYTAAALNTDEPLEDLINGNYTPASGGVAAYKSAVADATGKAVLAGLAAGTKYFIYVKPAATDTERLPGGSLCRTAVTGASLDNKVTLIKISTTPSLSAAFMGTSACLVCHATYATHKQTLHKLGIMAPGSPSSHQNLARFGANEGVYNYGKGLEKFTAGDATAGGTTVWFYDYDSTRTGMDKFKTLESAPTGTVYATVRAYKDSADNKYKMQFTNIINPADLNATMDFDVVLNYGGGLYKQRYMTRVPGKSSIYMLPLQFNQNGSDASTARTRKIWRDYHFNWWVSAATTTTMTFRTGPASANSFDIQCAPCHYTGYSVSKIGAEYVATGVADANGELHPITGTRMEMNIGCETCHGPGSEHINARSGKFIVTPGNITPERESMICGQCHSRSKGIDSFGLKNDSPLSAGNKMMLAGTSRADFLLNQTSRHDAATSDLWGDKKHSKSHRQQYTDFIQTKMYRNPGKLVTCASCHDAHAPGTDKHQLTGTDNNSICVSCHVVSHRYPTFYPGTTCAADKCIQCHITKISSSGAGNNAADPTIGVTTGAKYFQGDISSHLFSVPLKTEATPTTDPMPVPYTNNCGGVVGCHNMNAL